MKLIDLINSSDWNQIKDRLVELYPDQAKNIDGYYNVFTKSKDVKPKSSKLSIHLQNIVEEDLEYVHVNGVFTNPDDIKDGIDSMSLIICRWDEWVGMEITESALQNFTLTDCLCHILWEMSWVGYEEDSAAKFEKNLNKD